MASGVTYTFSANTKIRSAEVNANFDLVYKKLELYVQDGITGVNTLTQNQIIQHGWSYIQGNGTPSISNSITLPVPYDNVDYKVFVNYRGTKGGIPASHNDVSTLYSATIAKCNYTPWTVAAFGVYLELYTGTFSAGNYQIYDWMAIGTKV